MERHRHWNQVYTTKGEREVSWFEALPEISLEMLDAAGLTAQSCVLDVGGGDSHLVDALATRGLDCSNERARAWAPPPVYRYGSRPT